MQLLNQKMLAEQLGIHRTTIWRLVRAGKLLEPVTVGKVQLWPEDQINKYISEQDSTMTQLKIAERSVQESRTEFQNIGASHKKLQGEIAETQYKITHSIRINETEVAARTAAAIHGKDHDEQELIDPEALAKEVQAKQQVLTAVTEAMNDARIALKDAGDRFKRVKRQTYIEVLRRDYNMTQANRIPFSSVADFTMDQLLDLNALLVNAFNRRFSMSEMFGEVIERAKPDVFADSRERADRLMAA